MTISADDRDYLLTRGYDDATIAKEGWFSVPPGSSFVSEAGAIEVKIPYVGVWCDTPTGARTALQLVNPREKGYRKIKTTQGQYLPIYFATKEDYEGMELTHEVFLTEGIFDRRALKTVRPSLPVIALLGLGMSDRMIKFLWMAVKRVWLVLDRDEAGKKATAHIAKTLKSWGIEVEEIEYAYKDPAEWLAKRGIEKVKADLKLQIYRKSWGVAGV